MIGKVIWLGLVWLLYPYAMVPYIYESIHPIKLQVIHLLKKDMSEPGTRDCSNAWWHLGDEYGGSPPKRLTIDTQDILRWYQPIQVMEEPMPPFSSITATTPLCKTQSRATGIADHILPLGDLLPFDYSPQFHPLFLSLSIFSFFPLSHSLLCYKQNNSRTPLSVCISLAWVPFLNAPFLCVACHATP